ncbi:hypothetical protein SSS_02823 [Sarcoptes scabiei]|nr:hypothetical protein SSS_02823 [Sarcoptes scabiei]
MSVSAQQLQQPSVAPSQHQIQPMSTSVSQHQGLPPIPHNQLTESRVPAQSIDVKAPTLAQQTIKNSITNNNPVQNVPMNTTPEPQPPTAQSNLQPMLTNQTPQSSDAIQSQNIIPPKMPISVLDNNSISDRNQTQSQECLPSMSVRLQYHQHLFLLKMLTNLSQSLLSMQIVLNSNNKS